MKRKIVIAIASLTLASAVALGLCGCTASSQKQSSDPTSSAPEPTSSAEESPAEEQAEDPTEDSPQFITVKVLDKTRESIAGASFPDYYLETAYEYDDAGRLAGTSQSTNYPQSTLNLARGTFEYDDAGRLVKVSQAYEQYGWNVGNAVSFTYDEQGVCSSCSFEVVSQGNGSTSLAYTYADGRIARAVETDVIRPDTKTFDVSWAYSDDGRISKVVSGVGGEAGFGLVEELSDPAQGTYAYRSVYDSLTTLKYNDDGTLASAVTRSASGGIISQEIFEYKTITVDAATYTPTVYSNPTGFDPKWKPQVTLDEVPHALTDPATQS